MNTGDESDSGRRHQVFNGEERLGLPPLDLACAPHIHDAPCGITSGSRPQGKVQEGIATGAPPPIDLLLFLILCNCDTDHTPERSLALSPALGTGVKRCEVTASDMTNTKTTTGFSHGMPRRSEAGGAHAQRTTLSHLKFMLSNKCCFFFQGKQICNECHV